MCKMKFITAACFNVVSNADKSAAVYESKYIPFELNVRNYSRAFHFLFFRLTLSSTFKFDT